MSCEVKFSTDKKRALLRKPHLLEKLKKTGDCIKDLWSQKNPGMPKFLIVRPMVESEKFPPKINANTGWA